MKKLLLLCLTALFSININAFAGEPEAPSREEIINEVARQTGLTNDTVTLIAKESPQLLQGLNETVLGVKIVNAFCDARDTEALVDLLGYAVDKLKDKVFPTPMNTFLLAFGAYKTALEVIRDYYYVPKFDNKIYDKYREVRTDELRRGDTSPESISNCFEQATTQKDSGYYAVKTKMFDRMIAAKGYNKDQLGEKVEKKLWKEIDDFWMARCEAKLQQERLQQRKAEIQEQIWARVSTQLDAIKNAATNKNTGGPDSFFFTESTIPAGWKLSRYAESLRDFKPVHEPQSNRIYQRFNLYPAEFIEKLDPDGKNGSRRYPNGKPIPSEKARWMSAHIFIYPSVQPIPSGGSWSWKDRLVELVEKNVGWSSNMKIIQKVTGNGIEVGYLALEELNGKPRNGYECHFVKGAWLVEISVWGHFNFISQDKETVDRIVQDFASRMPDK